MLWLFCISGCFVRVMLYWLVIFLCVVSGMWCW